MRRILLMIAATSIPLSVAGIALVGTGTAGAATPITCQKVTGSLTGTVHFRGCTTPWAKGNAVGTSLATGGTISWKGKHAGSVTFSGSVTSPGQGSCPTGAKEYVASDTVTAVTGAGSAILKVGDQVSAQACRSKSGALVVTQYSVTG